VFVAVVGKRGLGPVAGGGAELFSGKVERLFVREAGALERLLGGLLSGGVKVEQGNSLVVRGSLDLSHSLEKVK